MKNQAKFSIFICILGVFAYNVNRIKKQLLNEESPEDMIIKEEYPAETHMVVTDDGYLLTVHRIPGPPGSVPVYLQHGLLSSSADWLKNGRGRSLAYVLWDHGYDVWMGNARGNIYSKQHTTLSTSDRKFWDFSWHEVGFYDVSAIIMYISSITNNTMFYVGHSMGGSTFSVMATQRPHIAKNVRAMIGLVPAIYEHQIQQSLLKVTAPHWKRLQTFADTFDIHQFLPRNVYTEILISQICRIPVIGSTACSNLLFFLFGYNPDQLDYTKLPEYLNRVPAGTSVKLFCHWLQQMTVNEFQNFDYGPEENLKIYNSSEPPKYDLTTIQVPVAVFLSDNDILDVRHFYNQVPNKLEIYEIGNSFNHGDFLWGMNATELIYYKILEIFKYPQLSTINLENKIKVKN